MSKRRLSPAPLPGAKRLHSLGRKTVSPPRLNFDDSLYDELVLVIFSYLPWMDLCAVQATNHHWSRLATDNQLWKALFLKEHGRSRLRGSRGFLGRTDGREIKSLPRKLKTEDDNMDWKWMFRISSNWRRGRCVQERLSERSESAEEDTNKTPIVIAGSLTITTSPNLSPSPPIRLLKPSSPPHELFGCHNGAIPTILTAISLDQSPPSLPLGHEVRLAGFYKTGEFTVFRVNHQTPSLSNVLCNYVPPSKTARTTPITQAVYHHPVLIALSKSFHLSIYNLSGSRVVHTQTLTSYTSFPPTSLVLSAPSPTTFKLVLAYAMPVYPSHWSVAATELTISSAGTAAPCTVAATRTTRAFDFPSGWVDDAGLRSVREQWGRRLARIADTQTDGKWVVLAPADDTAAASLQLYRLYLPAAPSVAPPRLAFVRTLHGHEGPVSALALADGRCVSLGADGSLWVWDLENAWGSEVQRAHRPLDRPGVRAAGAVVFNERRIISADATGVEMRRFDI